MSSIPRRKNVFLVFFFVGIVWMVSLCAAPSEAFLPASSTIPRDRQHAPFPTVFKFPNFLNHPKINLVGDARTEVNEVVVTGPGRRQTGAVWFADTFDLSDGFFSEFTLSISKIDNRGGEGLAFVFQKDDPYALGHGGDGMGYEGLGEGVAVEFDGKRDSGQSSASRDKEDDGAHVAVRNAITPGSRLVADHTKDVKAKKNNGDQLQSDSNQDNTNVVVPIPNLAQFVRPVDIRVEYNAVTGDLTCLFNVAKVGQRAEWMVGVTSNIGAIFGGKAYYVGFTASTGRNEAARFSITHWRFGVSNTKHQGCVSSFTGPDCSVTDEEAKRECPRRETCLGCVKNVYNCVWCTRGKHIKSGGECVVGNAHALSGCSDFTAEDLGCSSSLSLLWLWISLGVIGVVLVFGFVLVRTLPKQHAYRAVSLLVALGMGCILGMFLSFVVAAALVEISTTPMFSLGFGAFFFYLGFLIVSEVRKVRGKSTDKKWQWDQIASIVATVWIVLAGILCFVLDKRLVMWLPEWLKVIMFMILAGALNFCIVFSTVDICNEFYERWTRKTTSTPGLAEMLDEESRNDMFSPSTTTSYDVNESRSRVMTVARSKARYGILIVASLISGLFFGLVFGLLRIEEETVYRAALMLKQESWFTFPVGAFVGGMSGLLLQLVTLPMHTDSEIDRIINEAKDDL